MYVRARKCKALSVMTRVLLAAPDSYEHKPSHSQADLFIVLQQLVRDVLLVTFYTGFQCK